MHQTPAERAAIARTVMLRSAKMAGTAWPLVESTLTEPEGIGFTLLMGCALVDVIVQDDDGTPFIAAVNHGGAWMYPDTFSAGYCEALDEALDTALRISKWAGE